MDSHHCLSDIRILSCISVGPERETKRISISAFEILDKTLSLMHFCGYRGRNKERDQLDVPFREMALIMSQCS